MNSGKKCTGKLALKALQYHRLEIPGYALLYRAQSLFTQVNEVYSKNLDGLSTFCAMWIAVREVHLLASASIRGHYLDCHSRGPCLEFSGGLGSHLSSRYIFQNN